MTESFEKLFIEELQDMYSSENQITEVLPTLISLASLPELKEALSKHLKETQNQITRLEKIFTLLDQPAKGKRCKAMQGILNEGRELVENKPRSATLDAAIISAAQKVEHYEIASYGTLHCFAKCLEVKSEIMSLLKESLNEEGAADKALTKIAMGSLFSAGVNKQAANATALRR